ncbi:armadillo-type protein [Baffinella frigidus]|nr:armadillo-type protein [Cryptophyta sp. CCMP2293]
MSKADVDAAFAGWAVDARRLAPTGPDSRALIGALGGVRVLTHLCERSINRDADIVDDALVALNHLCVDDEAVEDLVCLGGLQVLADLLIDEEMPVKVHSHAAQLIPKVLLNDELRAVFLDLGVIPAILRLLKIKNETLVVRVLVVLLSIAQTEANRAPLRALGQLLLEPLVNLCIDNPETEQLRICVHLRISHVLVRILAHSRHPTAVGNAMHLTALLAEDPMVLRDIIDAGGLAPLVNLKNHGATSWICRSAGVVLAELGQVAGMRETLRELEDNHGTGIGS